MKGVRQGTLRGCFQATETNLEIKFKNVWISYSRLRTLILGYVTNKYVYFYLFLFLFILYLQLTN